MDIFKLSKSLDELIYDVMMWVIFYPYTLVRVIFTPGHAVDYVSRELAKPEDKLPFDNGISPPLFLFLSIIIGWIIAPEIPAELATEQVSKFSKLIQSSGWNQLLYALALYCVFPLMASVLSEWRTPGGITRETFRPFFYQQAYLCGPFALVSMASLALAAAHVDKDPLLAVGFLALMLGSFIWFLFAQTIFFRRTTANNYITALGLALLSLALGATLFVVISLVLE